MKRCLISFPNRVIHMETRVGRGGRRRVSDSLIQDAFESKAVVSEMCTATRWRKERFFVGQGITHSARRRDVAGDVAGKIAQRNLVGLVTYCCVTNNPRIWWLKGITILLAREFTIWTGLSGAILLLASRGFFSGRSAGTLAGQGRSLSLHEPSEPLLLRVVGPMWSLQQDKDFLHGGSGASRLS